MDEKTPGCDHCDVTINSRGEKVHDKRCPLAALRKIGHILKEAGIGVAEGAADVVVGGLGAMQDD